MAAHVNGTAALAALLVLLAAAFGCTADNPVDSIKTAVETRPIAQSIVDASQAIRDVQSYQAKRGENPPSLEALEASEGKLPRLPPGYSYRYDPETAKIEVVAPTR